MGVGSRGQEGCAPPPQIFKHGTNIVDKGLKVLFFGLFCYFRAFFPLSLPVKETKSAIFRSFFFVNFRSFFRCSPLPWSYPVGKRSATAE